MSGTFVVIDRAAAPESHKEIWSIVQNATTTLLPTSTSAMDLAKVSTMALGKIDVPFSQIETKVCPILFQTLLMIPRASQISYIRKDGIVFALYSKDQQVIAIYSNTSFSEATKARRNYAWYTQHVDSDTGKLYGDVVVFPPQLLANESWFQKALNTTHHPFASLGHSWHDVDNPLVLSTARVGDNEVVSLGFELKSLMNVLRGIIPFGGGFYLATKDGNVLGDGIPNTRMVLDGNATICFQRLRANGDRNVKEYKTVLRLSYQTPQVYTLENAGIKYILYSSSLDITGIQSIRIGILNCLRLRHDIRASLAGITGMIEMSINDLPQGSDLAKNLKRVKSRSEDLKIGQRKGLDVILDLGDGSLSKHSQVKGDKVKLKQILANLLSNAVKFTKEGYVSVRCRVHAINSRVQNSTPSSTGNKLTRCLLWFCVKVNKKFGIMETTNKAHSDPNYMEFVFEVIDTGKGIPKDKRVSVFENYVQVKDTTPKHEGTGLGLGIETAPEHEGTGLGLGIVQSLVRLMGGEISIVDNEVGEKGTCLAFSVVLDVCLPNSRNTNENEKTLSSGSNTPLRSPKRLDDKSSIVVIFISSDERRRVIQEFLCAHEIKVLAVKNIVELSQTLRELKQEQEKVSSSKSDLNKSFGWPRSRSSNTSPKNVPLSAMDGTDVSPTQSTNSLALSSFILLVLDTTRANFRELSKVVAEFRKDSKNEYFRVVWLGSRCIKLQGLDEKQLPPSDLIIPMPVHGTRLNSLINLLPEFGGMFPSTPPHQNQPTECRVDTVDDGWDEVIVPKPTDEVKTLKDTKGGQFIQWPRKYIKVLGRMSSNDSMSLPTSIPALTSPTTSAPVLCQMVQQELPSQATSSWSGSKTITSIQEEDDTIKKCMEMLPA
ncbi:histidine kinase CKI1-like protein [Tanacetum coccineum]